MRRISLTALLLFSACAAPTLSVRSTPTDADVRINNYEMGRTPLTLELDPGQTYEVEVSAPLYEVWRTSLRAPASGVRQDLEAILVSRASSDIPRVVAPSPPPTPGPRTALTIFVEPRGGRVMVDGRPVGVASAGSPVEVVYTDNPTAAGIVVEQTGFKRWTRAVTLESGRDNRIFIHLDPVGEWHSYLSDAELLRQAVEQIVASTASLPTLSRTAKIAIISIDHDEGTDEPLQALINDAFITTLAQAGFTPAERDDDMLVQLAHTGVGDSLPYRILTRNEGRDRPFIYDAEIATTQWITDTWTRTNIFTRSPGETEVATTHWTIGSHAEPLIGYVPTSNQFLAYRILSVGLSKIPIIEGEPRPEAMLHRRAELRVHVRVIDAPTGRITWAGYLTGQMADEIPTRVSIDLANPPLHFPGEQAGLRVR